MSFKFINKLLGRRDSQTQSMIQPNDALNVNELSKYTQIITNKETLGYKGLKRAFDEKLEVSLSITDESGERSTVNGIISHYDEKYEQLLVVTGPSLKRVVFSQINEVEIEADKDNKATIKKEILPKQENVSETIEETVNDEN